MEVLQCYEIVNDLIEAGVGAAKQKVTTLDGLISFGESVLASEKQTDAFYEKLLDRIGRTYIKYRRYYADNRDSIMRTPLDYGIIMQKVSVKNLAGMKENTSYKAQESPFSKEKDTTDIIQQLYRAFGVFETETKIIYDVQLRSAFTSAEAFGAFVDLIFSDMYNSMEVAIENLIKTAKAAMMAKALTGNGLTNRNVFMEYVAQNPNTTLTTDTCWTDVDYLKFVSNEINLASKRLKRMTRNFNVGGADRFTNDEDKEVEVLDFYAAKTQSYLDADTYHKELVGLPNYREVSSWKSDSDFSFDEISKIMVEWGTGQDKIEAVQSGIIACIYDRDAVGVLIERLRVVSQRNNMQELTNYAYKMDWAGYVDAYENCIVFYAEDTRENAGGNDNEG